MLLICQRWYRKPALSGFIEHTPLLLAQPGVLCFRITVTLAIGCPEVHFNPLRRREGAVGC